MRCYNCGKILYKKYNYCPECGKVVRMCSKPIWTTTMSDSAQASRIEDKIDRSLLNQRTIMKNLAFGFPELRKDEILNSALLIGIKETEKILDDEPSSLPSKEKLK